MLKLKKILPTSIFWRFLLIVTLPALIIQGFVCYFFFYRHWYKVSQNLTQNFIGKVAVILDTYNDRLVFTRDLSVVEKTQFLNHVMQYQHIKVHFQPQNQLLQKVASSSLEHAGMFSGGIRHVFRMFDFYFLLKRQLWQQFQVQFNLLEFSENIEVLQIEQDSGVINIMFDKHLLAIYSIYTFILLNLLLTTATLLASVLFLKKQIEPVKNLAQAVSAFGRGEQNIVIKARGAAEIRMAILAFIQMQERVIRQVNQHTLMLAGISHDLRTPLTRMKLQLEMLKVTPELENLKGDLADMEGMINDYLEFVKGDNGQELSAVRFKHFIHNIVTEYRNTGHKVSLTSRFDGRTIVNIKRSSLKRALVNFINNGLKFGTRVWVFLSSNEKNIIITIRDNGIGVPNQEKEKIFGAFYRSDTSRNLDISGTGLGTTIAKDIIVSHGGHIELSDNTPNGLIVTIYLPK